MAFPSTSARSLTEAWSHARRVAGAIKGNAESLRAAAAVTRMELLIYLNVLADALASLTAVAATPGLAAYAQQQQNDPALDIAAEFAAMRVQLIATQNWIINNFPKDSTGNAAVYSFDANKKFADVPLTAGQLTALRAQLALLSGTIA